MSTFAIYNQSLGLLTDLYQLTMAFAYWKNGGHTHEAVFNLFFRQHPFRGDYTVCCGLTLAADYLERFGFDDSDIAYLAGLSGNDGKPMFEHAFLEMLRNLKLDCDIDAVPEGTLVFPHEPMVRVRGPILQCQLLETALLNMINFQTLIATKAARVADAATPDPVLEFGLRRAQGVDGALSASWAAYVGGCAATSNVMAGKLFGIPVKGTHAHSWVMSFDDELSAFEAYAAAMPNNCVFLVDTYDTLQGVRNAVKVGKHLRRRGHEMAGVRLDSGDLAQLSIKARQILDKAGFARAAIIASNDLDEHAIDRLKKDGALIGVWGVGTKLITAYDQPALGGVYKLAAMREPGQDWRPKLKLSEDRIKTSIPGVQQVRRFSRDGIMLADVIYDETLGMPNPPKQVLFEEGNPIRTLSADTESEDLLRPVFRAGQRVWQAEPIELARRRAMAQRRIFLQAKTKRGGQAYPVGMAENLFQRQQDLIDQIKLRQEHT